MTAARRTSATGVESVDNQSPTDDKLPAYGQYQLYADSPTRQLERYNRWGVEA
jgi:hypothetical protein